MGKIFHTDDNVTYIGGSVQSIREKVINGNPVRIVSMRVRQGTEQYVYSLLCANNLKGTNPMYNRSAAIARGSFILASVIQIEDTDDPMFKHGLCINYEFSVNLQCGEKRSIIIGAVENVLQKERATVLLVSTRTKGKKELHRLVANDHLPALMREVRTGDYICCLTTNPITCSYREPEIQKRYIKYFSLLHDYH